MHSVRQHLLKKRNMDSGDVMKDIPSELKDSLANLDQSLSQLGENFSPLLSTVQSELQSKVRIFKKNKDPNK